nr:ribonuclease H-like domain-containing protein [Tanacetum cinerariifolium]
MDERDVIEMMLDNEDRAKVMKKRGQYYSQRAPVRTALLTRVPLPDVKDAYAIVSREESHRGISETSEANQHLTTSTIGMINVVDISNLNITVGHPNGTVATVSHVGDLRLSNNVIMYDVLVVLGYCVSLLSVNKLIKDSKLFVMFYEDKCYIQDFDKGITLGTSSESGGLYLFDDTMNKSLGNVNIVMAFNVSKYLWHNRLGQPADQVLKVLKNDLNLSKNTSVSVCETCHSRFVCSLRKGNSLVFRHFGPELVHLDLWGPYRVSSREGFKYFDRLL